MNIITFVVCLFLFILCLFIFGKKPLQPVILFYGLWSFILFLSILNLYGMYKPSDKAYLLILLMLIFFFAGSIFPSFRFRRRQTSIARIYKLNFRIYYILMGISILFACIDVIIMLQYFFAGVPIWQIRNWILEATGSNNPILTRRSFIETAFRTIILSPFGAIVGPITAYYFFEPETRNDKKRYTLLFLSLLNLILTSISNGGGRLGLICYFGYFLIAYLTFSNKKLFLNFNKRKYKKYIALLLCVGFIGVMAFTRFRTGVGNFAKQTYTYFALAPTLLSVWLPELEHVSHTYGMLTFFGVHSYFFRIFNTIGLDFFVPQIYNVLYQHILNAEIFRSVGSGVSNAFVTPIYYFYIDGGYPFVCIASMFFGNIVSQFYKKFVSNINIKSFTYYALIMYGVFVTFMRIQTCIPSYWISFLMVNFLLCSHKVSNGNVDAN